MNAGDPNRAPNLYEVEPVTPHAARHRADLHLWERAWLAVHTPDEATEVARSYWRGDMVTGRFEWLTTSDLRIVRVVERSRSR